MSRKISKTLLAMIPNGSLVPCQITQVNPLLVTLQGATGIPGEKLAGLAYSTSPTNNAYALLKSPGKPLILPLGV
jgi:hypothetical protein